MLSKNIDVFEKLSKSLRLAKGDLDLVGSADDIDGVFSPNIGSADDIKKNTRTNRSRAKKNR